MKIAHILVCHAVDPTRAIESVPHEPGALWYVFLHGSDPTIELIVHRLMAERGGNVFAYRENRGLARSWNDGLHLAIEAGCDGSMLMNDDLFFYEGGYRTIVESFEHVRNLSRNIFMVTMNGLKGPASPLAGQVHVQSFSCCILPPEAIDRLGYFDETFIPAYFEDCDYQRRGLLSGMTIHVEPRVLVEHARMSTFRAIDPAVRSAWDEAQGRNARYFEKKWGGGTETATFQSPFDNPKLGLKIAFANRREPYQVTT